jgi:hypothetical protein
MQRFKQIKLWSKHPELTIRSGAVFAYRVQEFARLATWSWSMPEPAIIMLRLAGSMIDQPENSRTDDQLSAIPDNAAERKSPIDFSAWFEVYLGDRWYTLDARHTSHASAAS